MQKPKIGSSRHEKAGDNNKKCTWCWQSQSPLSLILEAVTYEYKRQVIKLAVHVYVLMLIVIRDWSSIMTIETETEHFYSVTCDTRLARSD